MSKHIQANTEEPNNGDFDLIFPHFAYVIRDFHLDLEIEGRTLTEDEYLEAALTPKVYLVSCWVDTEHIGPRINNNNENPQQKQTNQTCQLNASP